MKKSQSVTIEKNQAFGFEKKNQMGKTFYILLAQNKQNSQPTAFLKR